MIAYKLLKRRRDGTLGPLFINASQRIPIGVWLGIRLNKKLSEEGFMKVVYALTLLAGLQLLFNFNPLEFLKPS